MESRDAATVARRLASSPLWSDRKEAGVLLAGLLGEVEVADDLRLLLLDEQDTGVTVSTARVLLTTRAPAAVRLVMEAFRDGDEEHQWHIGIEVAPYESDEAVRTCLNELALDPGLQATIVDLCEWLHWV